MKTGFLQTVLAAGLGASLIGGGAASAQTTVSSATYTSTAGTDSSTVTASGAPVRLSWGVADVLKLSRAQVGEDVIVNYIQNSGVIYSLSSTEIVYLRNEGVTDRVLTAMLDQKKRVTAEVAARNAAAAQTAAAGAATTATTAPAQAAPATTTTTTYAPAYVQPVEVQPASTVYVIQDPAVRAAYYGYPYYYYGSPCYYSTWPAISVGFRFGGGWGFHGGGHFHGGHR
jgi:hypothetical protein